MFNTDCTDIESAESKTCIVIYVFWLQYKCYVLFLPQLLAYASYCVAVLLNVVGYCLNQVIIIHHRVHCVEMIPLMPQMLEKVPCYRTLTMDKLISGIIMAQSLMLS